jgi:hypothetical protein
VKWLENDKVIGRRCPREHHKGTHVTSRGSPTGDVWWRHFRWKGPTRADVAQRLVVHARTLPMEPPSGSRDVTSGSHVGHAQWYILYYYYSKKKARELVAHAHFRSGPLPVTSLPFRAASGDVISGQGRFR